MSRNRKNAIQKNSYPKRAKNSEAGFSLMEVTVAFLIFLIAMLGIFASFTYAINYNAGNNARAEALALLQRRVEEMRSAKFTPGVTDNIVRGGVRPREFVTLPNGNRYSVDITVDNDPFTAGVQGETTSTTLKEITVTVTMEMPTPGWQTAVPATVVLRRSRSN